MPGFLRHFKELEKEEDPTVLVSSFEELENRAFKSIEKLNLIPVGPLIPSAFLTGDDPLDTSFGGDLFRDKKDLYMEWLSSMPSRSVIYVAFGSLRSVTKQQLEEIAAGLLKFNRPFLWVITNAKDKGDAEDESEEPSCRQELEKLGKIVPWCSQVEVLSSSSVGGFFSHCGWNSTLESLVAGVPMVAFPHWSDQFTNAKLIEDEWRCGVRVKTNGDGVAEGEEIRRCLEMVMVWKLFLAKFPHTELKIKLNGERVEAPRNNSSHLKSRTENRRRNRVNTGENRTEMGFRKLTGGNRVNTGLKIASTPLSRD